MQPAAPEPGAVAPTTPAAGLAAEQWQRLAQLLDSLERIVGEQVTGGRQLVQALTDQLADGQVETLYSLHTATTAVRRQAQQIEHAAQTPLREVRALVGDLQAAAVQLGRTATTATQLVADALTEDVAVRLVEVEDALTASARQTAQSATAGLREQLALETTAIAERLAGLVAASVDLWSERLGEMSVRLAGDTADVEVRLVARTTELERAVTTAADTVTQRITSTGEALDASTRDLDSQVAAVRSTLEQEVASATTALAEAGAAAAAEVHAAGLELLQGLRAEAAVAQSAVAETAALAERRLTRGADKVAAVAAATVDGIEFAGRALSDMLTEHAESLAGQREELLTGLHQQLEAQEQREQRLVARSDARVQRLVERSDQSVARVVEQLRVEVDRLAARDRELEAERAEQFVRVLDELLSRAGARGRDLRERVTRVLQADRRDRSPSAEPAAAPPPTEPAEPAAAEAEPAPTPSRTPRASPPARRLRPAPSPQGSRVKPVTTPKPVNADAAKAGRPPKRTPKKVEDDS